LPAFLTLGRSAKWDEEEDSKQNMMKILSQNMRDDLDILRLSSACSAIYIYLLFVESMFINFVNLNR
jgi:hypothetical protein